jgi:hypothetical protein
VKAEIPGDLKELVSTDLPARVALGRDAKQSL